MSIGTYSIKPSKAFNKYPVQNKNVLMLVDDELLNFSLKDILKLVK